ncbi:MAG: bifunctional diaminohydroxyphosphoribosylaminopyrimidine deaminase/5-amino-6-(5-phosphoribosylamino)uracil reductase RibD [Vibrio sp.]
MNEFEPSAFDKRMMQRALTLAKQGLYTTAPNPNVGCVICLDEQVVGEGAHLKAGEGHAEVHALTMAQDLAQGATAYVTLEPCSHFGRTPPCAQGLIDAKVKRVVCAMQDPNPQVAGRGIQMLRDAGIEVDVGLYEDDAKALNPAFIKTMQTGLPFVQLKLAMSLDGKTALANGESQWITSPDARRDVQVYRAKAGAILSTSRTVLRDNASLNVRFDELPQSVQDDYPSETVRQPVRLILNRNHSIKPDAIKDLKLFSTPGDVVMIEPNECVYQEGVESFAPVIDSTAQIDLRLLLQELAVRKQVNHIWVEAGSTLATSLLAQDLVDELIVYIAPKLMGDDAQGLTGFQGMTAMSETKNFTIQDVTQIGSDVRLTMTKPQE